MHEGQSVQVVHNRQLHQECPETRDAGWKDERAFGTEARERGKRSASAFPQDPSTTARDSLSKTTSSDWVPSTDRREEAWVVAILEGSRC